jgi:enterochelin esterase-like enzyme
MKYFISTIILTLLLGFEVCIARDDKAAIKEDFKPSSVNQLGKLYPQVNSEGRVRVSISAPEANLVQLDIGGVKYDLTKDEKGVWTGESALQDEGFHYYQLNIDGASVPDPGTKYFYGAGRWGSGIEIPAVDQDFYAIKDVSHGSVSERIYFSEITSAWRRCFVYTPPGYDPDISYPVLYLLGGSGELPSNWIYDGRVNLIMDNLLAEDKAEPMLIVIPNNQVIHRNHPKHVELTFDIFEEELRKHVIPLVESNYTVQMNLKGRALSGLSKGGRHTMFIGFRSLDLFASFGVLSAGDVNAETSVSNFLNDPEVNNKLEYLFAGQETMEAEGFMGKRCIALHEALTNHNIKHEYYVGGHGGHDWATWRHLLYYSFLPNLWRTK